MNPSTQSALRQIAELAKQVLDDAATRRYREEAGHNLPPDYPEVLRQIALAVSRRLEENGVARPLALTLGLEAAEEVRFLYGGDKVYINSQAHEKCAQDELYAEIYAAFDGTNAEELGKQYSMTPRWIQQIIKRQRKKGVAERQEKMF